MYSHSLFLEVFYLAEMFNSDVSKWVTSSVTTLRQMFEGAKMFNSDISKWDVSSATDMLAMFKGCIVFNSDISKWDVSSATDMRQCTSLSKNYTLSCYFLFWRTCADNMYHMCVRNL
jgi:surface protein